MNDIQNTIKSPRDTNTESVEPPPPQQQLSSSLEDKPPLEKEEINDNKETNQQKSIIPEIPSTINEESLSSIPEVSNPLVTTTTTTNITTSNDEEEISNSIKPNYHLDDSEVPEEDNNKTPTKVLSDNSLSQLPESFTLNNNNNNNNISSHEEVSEIINEDSTFDDHSLTFEQDSTIQQKKVETSDNNNSKAESNINIENSGISFSLDEMMNDLENIGTTTTTTTASTTNAVTSDNNVLDLDDLERELNESLNH